MGERPRYGHRTREAIRRGDSDEQRRYALILDHSPHLGLIRGFTGRRSVSPAQYPETPSPAYHSRSPSPAMPEPHPHTHQPTSAEPVESPTSIDESQPLPNPTVNIEDEGPSQLDERSLNALAAREVSKQMEMFSPPLSPPSLPFAGRRSVSPRPSFTAGTGLVRSLSPPPPPPPPPQFTNLTLTRELTQSPNLPQHPQLQPPPPPAVALPDSKSMDSDFTQPDDVYRTPPEYLRNSPTPSSPSMTPAPPPVPQVKSTLNPSPTTQAATKKISAAAFRRPGMKALANMRDDTSRQDSLGVGFRSSPGRSPSREGGDDENGVGGPDNAGTPLNLRKKSLPAVPGISTNLVGGPRSPGGSRSISSPFPNLKTGEQQPLGPGRTFPLSASSESRPRESMFGGGDEDFDYVSAYLNEDERRQNGTSNGTTNDHGGGPGTSPPQDDGYGSGRFATRLDN